MYFPCHPYFVVALVWRSLTSTQAIGVVQAESEKQFDTFIIPYKYKEPNNQKRPVAAAQPHAVPHSQQKLHELILKLKAPLFTNTLSVCILGLTAGTLGLLGLLIVHAIANEICPRDITHNKDMHPETF